MPNSRDSRPLPNITPLSRKQSPKMSHSRSSSWLLLILLLTWKWLLIGSFVKLSKVVFVCVCEMYFVKCVCVQLLSRVRLFLTPRVVACQASLSMGFSRQEHWSGLPCSSPGIFPTQEMNPCLLPWQADSLLLTQWESPRYHYIPIKMTKIWNTDNGKY